MVNKLFRAELRRSHARFANLDGARILLDRLDQATILRVLRWLLHELGGACGRAIFRRAPLVFARFERLVAHTRPRRAGPLNNFVESSCGLGILLATYACPSDDPFGRPVTVEEFLHALESPGNDILLDLLPRPAHFSACRKLTRAIERHLPSLHDVLGAALHLPDCFDLEDRSRDIDAYLLLLVGAAGGGVIFPEFGADAPLLTPWSADASLAEDPTGNSVERITTTDTFALDPEQALNLIFARVDESEPLQVIRRRLRALKHSLAEHSPAEDMQRELYSMVCDLLRALDQGQDGE